MTLPLPPVLLLLLRVKAWSGTAAVLTPGGARTLSRAVGMVLQQCMAGQL
jgi:hypothetical protein